MTGFICKRYALYVLAAMVISVGIGFLLDTFGAEMPRGVPLVITTMIPAMWAGSTWYKETNEVPESSLSWSMALRFTGIQFVFSIILIGFFLVAFPETLTIISGGIAGLLFGAFIFAALLILLISRFFFPFGAKQVAKVANKA